MTSEAVFVNERREHVVQESTINTSVSADEVLAALRQRKATGELRFVLNQGGVQRIVLSEKRAAQNKP